MNPVIGMRAVALPSVRISIALCILILAFVAPASSGSDFSRRFHARAHLASFESELKNLSSRGYDIAGFDESKSTVHLIVTSEDFDRLMDMGYKMEILPDPAPFKRSPGTGIKAPASTQAANIVIDDGYHHFRQVDSILEQFQTAFPDIALMVDIGSSHYGRTIWALKISDNVALDEDEPAIMFNGLHHARELISTEVVLDTIQYLTTRYGNDPYVTRWVDTWEIWLIPIVNPDGNDIVFTRDENWRKNARDNNLNGVIDSGDGVDLNRNYPFKWGISPGSSGDPKSSTYRGPAPASEPETQAIIALSLKERFVFSIAYHSYGGVVLFPYGSQAAVNPIPNISRSVCADFARACTREDGTRYDLRPRLYDVNGLDRDWHYHNGTIGFVVELSLHGFQPEYDTWRDAVVEGVRPGWQYLLNRIDGPSIFGHVRDEQADLPVAATITIDEIKFFEGEVRVSDSDTGSYHWIVDPGTYNINFSAGGYVVQSFHVNVEDGAAFNLQVMLQPEVASISDAEEGEGMVHEAELPTSTLLQNYPNPFNPGTWLPFTLSDPADVTICIYDVRGVLIRQLCLGYTEAGSYVSRSKAAFWDCTDGSGKRAASGIYFYSIQAGDFTATKKMAVAKAD